MAKRNCLIYKPPPVRDSIKINIDVYVERGSCSPKELTRALKGTWRFLGLFWVDGRYSDQHYCHVSPERSTQDLVEAIFHCLWEFFGCHVDACVATTRYIGGPLGGDKVEEDWMIDEDDLEYQVWKEAYDRRKRREARNARRE